MGVPEALDELKNDIGSFIALYNDLKKENEELTATLMKYYNLQAEYDYLKECNSGLATHIHKLENQIDELKNRNDELDKENEELYDKIKELDLEFIKLNEELDWRKSEAEALGRELDEYTDY